MHRTQILIEDWQYEVLKSMASREGRSISELLRAILARHLRDEAVGSKPGLAEIEGLGNDPDASGREHDRFLYDIRQ